MQTPSAGYKILGLILALLFFTLSGITAEPALKITASLDAATHPKIVIQNTSTQAISFEAYTHTWDSSFKTDTEGVNIISSVPGANALIKIEIAAGGQHVFEDVFHTLNVPPKGIKIGFVYGGQMYWSNLIELAKK